MKKILRFFDKLEDVVRIRLSRKPIAYAAIVSVGTVFLWRGIWLIADHYSINGFVSAGIGAVILLMTGIFVSGFIGNRIILTGMRSEKKLTEKTREEVEKDIELEKEVFRNMSKSLSRIERELEDLSAHQGGAKR